ncbi:MAG TPA: HlyD family efflux transporter periplasmic adaptor subunit [Bacteroidota bacterium]|nr:HlyD family efflux transporter periplasmic adaptor subunit [Bacteroidota bacterium]
MKILVSCCLSLFLSLLVSSCASNDGRDITASGIIEGTDINIGVEVAGKVKTLLVDEGSRVRKGDTLVVIDDTDYQMQFRQAAANFGAADAAYNLAVEGSRKEDIIQAEANYQNAETDFNRMKGLLASQTATQKQYDDANTRFVLAQQTLDKLKRGLRPEEIRQAKDRRDNAAAQLDYLKKKLHDCVILAPSGGIITLKAIEPGELVGVGMNVLRLTYLDRVKLMIYVREESVGKIRLGDKAKVAIDGQTKTFEGKVVYISPTAEFTPKNVQTQEERTKLVFGVRLEIANPDGLLKPGLPADASVTASGA